MEREPDITVEFFAQPYYLAVIRTFIGCLCENMPFREEEALQLEICVDEACANSIEGMKHLEGDCFPARVRLELTFQKDGLLLTVADRGKDFSSQFLQARPLGDFSDRTRRRGYGLQIIKTLMDGVSYSHDPQTGNRLSFVKYFSTPIR